MAGRVGKRKPVARRSSFRSVALLLVVPLAGFALFFAVRGGGPLSVDARIGREF